MSADLPSESGEMSYTAEAIRSEMTERVREIAALAPEDSRKAALNFTAKLLRLPVDRVRRLFYGEVRRIEAHEADQIRAYYAAAIKLIEARQKYEAYRAGFLRDHPALAVLVPPPVSGAEVQEDRAETVAKHLARGKE